MFRRRRERRDRREPEPQDFATMRARAFSARPEKLRISRTAALPRVWGAVMELGIDSGPVTVVCLADDTSLLLLADGSVTRGGDFPPIRDANRRFLARAEGLLELTLPVQQPPLPSRREVRFHVLTYRGIRSASGSGPELAAGGGALFPLFVAGRDVLTSLRALEGRPEPERQPRG